MRGKDSGNDERTAGEEPVQQAVEPRDTSVENLLLHMRQVRAAIPVNQNFREELRQRLLQMAIHNQGLAGSTKDQPEPMVETGLGSGSGGGGKSSRPADGCSQKKRVWQWGIAALVVLVVFTGLWYSVWAPKALEAGPTREVARLWTEGSFLDLAVNSAPPSLLVAGEKGLSILTAEGQQVGFIRPPLDQVYLAAAWSETGDRLTLIKRGLHQEDQIIQVVLGAKSGPAGIDLPQLEVDLTVPEILYTAEKGQRLHDLIWSPDGKTLAVTFEDASGLATVGLLTPGKELIPIGSGQNPAWAPDNSRLVVERPGTASDSAELWLLNRDGSNPVRLLEGEKPVWGNRGYLVYIQVIDTERVLTYDLEGAPLFKVQQRLGEIRSIRLGSNGEAVNQSLAKGHPLNSDFLVLAPDTRPGIYELNWLRQLELEGVREPRTLLLDQVNQFYKIEFGQADQTLLIARQEGGTVVLEQIGLREKLLRAR